MTLFNRSLPKPENWESFEHYTWLLFCAELNDPSTHKNGRKGQAQDGVDIYGRRDKMHWVGIQCKTKLFDFVTEKELRSEVEKAKKFRPKLSEYILVTTAPSDVKIQVVARNLTDELSGTENGFSVSVWGWEQFRDHAANHPKVWKKMDPSWNPVMDEGNQVIQDAIRGIESGQKEILRIIKERENTHGVGPEIGEGTSHLRAKISVLIEMINDGEIELPKRKLISLKNEHWNNSQPLEKYEILIGLASAAFHLGEIDNAGNLLEQAHEVCPTHDSAARNFALCKLLNGEFESAVKISERELEKNPDDELAATTLIQARSFIPDINLMNGICEDMTLRPRIIAAQCWGLRNRGDDSWVNMALSALNGDQECEQARYIWAEAIFTKEVDNRSSVTSGRINDLPTLNELHSAANLLYKFCTKRETFISAEMAHNAGVALRLVDRNDDANEVLRIGIRLHPDDTSIMMQLGAIALEKQNFEEVLRLFPNDNRTPEIIAMVVEAIARLGRSQEALDKIKETDTLNWSKDQIFILLLVETSILLELGQFQLSIDKCKMAVAQNSKFLRFKVLLAKSIRIVGDLKHAKRKLDEAFASLSSGSTMSERVDLAIEYGHLEEYDAVVSVLSDHVSLKSDSVALRCLLVALVETRRHREAITIFNEINNEVVTKEWYLRTRAFIAISSGDADTEQYITTYLNTYPDSLHMQIHRLKFLQAHSRDNEIRKSIISMKEKIPNGSALDRMNFFLIAINYVDQKWVVDLAYQELLRNWEDPDIHLSYQRLIVACENFSDKISEPSIIKENCVFETQSKDGTHRFRIEANEAHAFEAERYDPSSDFFKSCRGKSAGEKFFVGTILESLEYQVIWIKSCVLDLFHRSIDEFSRRFPSNSGMQSFSIDIHGSQPFSNIEGIVKSAFERDRLVLDNYNEGKISFYFISKFLGIDPIDGWGDLAIQGVSPQVCDGSQKEIDGAIAEIISNNGDGCVLDPITAALSSDLNLWGIIKELCGQAYVTQSTLTFFSDRETEAYHNINRLVAVASWQNGEFRIIEIPSDQVKEDFERKKRQHCDIVTHCEIATAIPRDDISDENAKFLREFILSSDSVLAANGKGILLLSEDKIFRNLASCLNVSGIWLQPLLSLARSKNSMSSISYAKFIGNCIDLKYDYIHIDAQVLLTQAKLDGPNNLTGVRRMLRIMGGEKADVKHNLGVAAEFLDGILEDTKFEYMRDKYASLVLKEFCASRPDMEISLIDGLTSQVRHDQLGLQRHCFWWHIGRYLGSPRFAEEVERAKKIYP